MNRIVLAILALFAGLAAQVAPAQARLDTATEIGAAVSVHAGVRQVTVAASAVFRPPTAYVTASNAPLVGHASAFTLVSPTIYIGIDRARQ